MSAEAFHSHLAALRAQVEAALAENLRRAEWPESLRSAVEYSLMAGGKRLRPVLVLLACEVCGGRGLEAMPAACAIEMIHTYSLIHDDLPSMDNDDYRRGRLTSHKVYGEALAILAGDCLLTLAFETLAGADLDSGRRAELVRILGMAAGGRGMVGGQVLDLEAERGSFLAKASAETAGVSGNGRAEVSNSCRNMSNQTSETRVEELTQIHRMKTGALIAASLEMGAVSAGASSERRQKLREYGHCIGLAFQIADDLLDVTGDAAKLGKTPGRDIDLGKLTYPALLGMEASRQKAAALIQDACESVQIFGDSSQHLQELARFIVERDH
ncbi:MAG: polyprenyl synthetase family protein [Planctomycetaceae bacterium]